MSTFNFKLEKILDYKRTVEDYKKGRYGSLKRRLHNEEEKLDVYNRHKADMELEMNRCITKTKAGNLAMYNNYINDMSRRIAEQKRIVNKAKKELEAARNEMVAAIQEKKTFEKLKEKEHKEYLYRLKKIEEKQIDALVTYRTSIQQ